MPTYSKRYLDNVTQKLFEKKIKAGDFNLNLMQKMTLDSRVVTFFYQQVEELGQKSNR